MPNPHTAFGSSARAQLIFTQALETSTNQPGIRSHFNSNASSSSALEVRGPTYYLIVSTGFDGVDGNNLRSENSLIFSLVSRLVALSWYFLRMEYPHHMTFPTELAGPQELIYLLMPIETIIKS